MVLKQRSSIKDYEYYLIPRELTFAKEKMEAILGELIGIAIRKGFNIKVPCVEVHNSRQFGLLGSSYNRPARAEARGGIKIVYDLDFFLVDYDLGYARAVMAHELGHIIDQQGYFQRVGHPLFDSIRHLNNESFADAFASYLCSKEEVIEGLKKPYYRSKLGGLTPDEILALDF